MLPRPMIGAGIGYVVALISSSIMPEFASLLLPVLGVAVGSALPAKKPPAVPPVTAAPIPAAPLQSRSDLPVQEQRGRSFANSGPSAPATQASQQPVPQQRHPEPLSTREAVQVNPVFEPVLQYLEVLEDMIISEGQQNNLDNEIVEKSCALFLRLTRVIPLISELHNDEINHTVKRLVLKDLNGVINPFLRLSGESKSKNRRVLLNGLKDVDSKITDIVRTIEHKDLLELQTKADLIHQRYANS